MRALMVLMVFVAGTWSMQVTANPIHVPQNQDREMESLIHDCSHAVEEAWEAFHRAALGGTLASPAVQVDIESSLHAARELLLMANDSVDQGDKQAVIRFSSEIMQITEKIKRESQRKKQ